MFRTIWTTFFLLFFLAQKAGLFRLEVKWIRQSLKNPLRNSWVPPEVLRRPQSRPEHRKFSAPFERFFLAQKAGIFRLEVEWIRQSQENSLRNCWVPSEAFLRTERTKISAPFEDFERFFCFFKTINPQTATGLFRLKVKWIRQYRKIRSEIVEYLQRSPADRKVGNFPCHWKSFWLDSIG